MSRWQDTFFLWPIKKTPIVIWRNWVNQRMELIITFVCSPSRQLLPETWSPSVWFLGCLASFSQIPVDDILSLFSSAVWTASLILLSQLSRCSQFRLMSSSLGKGARYSWKMPWTLSKCELYLPRENENLLKLKDRFGE